MSIDAGLRTAFHQNLKRGQWTAIETGSVSPGVPDSEFCFPGGIQGWVEHKRAQGNVIKFQPMQPGWIDRRARLGGRVFIAVRHKQDLIIFHGRDVIKLAKDGLKGAVPLGRWTSPWDWVEVEELLRVGF